MRELTVFSELYSGGSMVTEFQITRQGGVKASSGLLLPVQGTWWWHAGSGSRRVCQWIGSAPISYRPLIACLLER